MKQQIATIRFEYENIEYQYTIPTKRINFEENVVDGIFWHWTNSIDNEEKKANFGKLIRHEYIFRMCIGTGENYYGEQVVDWNNMRIEVYDAVDINKNKEDLDKEDIEITISYK